VPGVVPVKLTVQVLGPAPLPESAQDAVAGVTPAPDAVTLNVPVGAVGVPVAVSETVTVQLLATFVPTGFGEQLTVVVVALLPLKVTVSDGF
jgi:hypothetical protein